MAEETQPLKRPLIANTLRPHQNGEGPPRATAAAVAASWPAGRKCRADRVKLDAALVPVNMSFNCCVVTNIGGLAGGSPGTGVGGNSWLACVACVPAGGDAPKHWEPPPPPHPCHKLPERLPHS